MKVSAILLLALGSFLIVTGVLQVFLQWLANERTREHQQEVMRTVAQSTRVEVSGLRRGAAYPGVWMVGLGAVLVLAGAQHVE